MQIYSQYLYTVVGETLREYLLKIVEHGAYSSEAQYKYY